LSLLKKLGGNNLESIFFSPWASPRPWQWSTWGWRETPLPRWPKYLKPFPTTVNTVVNLLIQKIFYVLSPPKLSSTHHSASGTVMRMGQTVVPLPGHGGVGAHSCGCCNRQLGLKVQESLLTSLGHCYWLTVGAFVLLLGIRSSFHLSRILLCEIS
jgi:hypothetical protein